MVLQRTPGSTGCSRSTCSPHRTGFRSRGPPDLEIGEREVCVDLPTIAVETTRLAAGTTVLADKGQAGREIEGVRGPRSSYRSSVAVLRSTAPVDADACRVVAPVV